ncbi:hypothetical protein [Roseateles sp. BYS87W]|uniref:Secreted protein n=1 Tax=Pelomonas baiyunensis TaxID=3299026 RepID=A0ABW7H2A7_9BURK
MKACIPSLAALTLACFATLAGATTVYVEGFGATQSLAATAASNNWRSSYPNGTYQGIYRCSPVGGATAPNGTWDCVAYGDVPSTPPKTIVTASAHGDPASLACQRAMTSWNSQYGATSTFTGTSVVEVYGNGGNARPTDFICTATGYKN